MKERKSPKPKGKNQSRARISRGDRNLLRAGKTGRQPDSFGTEGTGTDKNTASDLASKLENSIDNFYAVVLDEAERIDFETAAGIDGIDDEIAILRMKIRAILEDDPKNIKLLMAVTEILTKMVKTRYKINGAQKKGLKEGIANIIKEIAVPAGIAILKDRTGQG